MINYVQDCTATLVCSSTASPEVPAQYAAARGIPEELNVEVVGAMADLDLTKAQQVLETALKKAAEIDTLMNVAVVDAGGNLKAFGRMDGAWLGSIDISIRKARTARYFDMNTGDLGAASQPGGPLYNIEVSNGGLITFPGGIPLRDGNGEVVGGIGVSGSSVENDHTVAEAGANALGSGGG